MVYVVDSSVAAKWFFPEIHSDSTRRLRVYSDQLHAPEYFMIELGSLISKKVRRNEIDYNRANDLMQLMKGSPVQLQPWRSCYERAFEWSLQLQQTIYDLLYLLLAETMDGQFVTADKKFLNGLSHDIRDDYCLWIEDIPDKR